MKWEILSTEQQFLDLLDNESLFAIFKHSTRCSISSMAKNRVERDWDLDFPIYYLDLIQYRSVSNLIAAKSGIEHQSPQLIVFQNGLPVYDASHNAIDANEIKSNLVI
ncbi:MAG TPA: bacillithiol system redox-active protein YtxJ [Chitinophagales bacterium]|nr:bacillithiol system redox-active protein YtxJ [Chitinophagales bacterium]